MIRNYLLHMRPRAWSPSFLFVLTGYAASPMKPDSVIKIIMDLVLLYLIYSVLLFGGTSALNTSQDTEDLGPLNYLEHPPARPTFLGLFGIGLMLAAIAISFFINPVLFWASFCAFILSLLYSCKIPILGKRGKTIGGLDLVINSLGCGAVGVCMGWGMTSAPMDYRGFIIAIAFTISVMGSYPSSQIFQLKESDTYATAKNFSTLLGPRTALRVGSCLLLVAFILVLYEIFLRYIASPLPLMTMLSYVLFGICFLVGIHRCWVWGRAPFHQPKLRAKNLVFILLLARLAWIAAEWSLSQ